MAQRKRLVFAIILAKARKLVRQQAEIPRSAIVSMRRFTDIVAAKRKTTGFLRKMIEEPDLPLSVLQHIFHIAFGIVPELATLDYAAEDGQLLVVFVLLCAKSRPCSDPADYPFVTLKILHRILTELRKILGEEVKLVMTDFQDSCYSPRYMLRKQQRARRKEQRASSKKAAFSSSTADLLDLYSNEMYDESTDDTFMSTASSSTSSDGEETFAETSGSDSGDSDSDTDSTYVPSSTSTGGSGCYPASEKVERQLIADHLHLLCKGLKPTCAFVMTSKGRKSYLDEHSPTKLASLDSSPSFPKLDDIPVAFSTHPVHLMRSPQQLRVQVAALFAHFLHTSLKDKGKDVCAESLFQAILKALKVSVEVILVELGDVEAVKKKIALAVKKVKEATSVKELEDLDWDRFRADHPTAWTEWQGIFESNKTQAIADMGRRSGAISAGVTAASARRKITDDAGRQSALEQLKNM